MEELDFNLSPFQIAAMVFIGVILTPFAFVLDVFTYIFHAVKGEL